MPETLLDIESLLVIDTGSVTTRAALFDVVDDCYRYLGSGSGLTSPNTSEKSTLPGIRQALAELTATTGRDLLGDNNRVIQPGSSDNTGVDRILATVSMGAPLKILAVGLVEEMSVESARHLARTTYCDTLETIGLGDPRRPEELIAVILQLRPDLIIVAGGTNKGAYLSLLNLLEPIRLACISLPEEMRPHLLFAGNQTLLEKIQEQWQPILKVHSAPNIRPNQDNEQLGPAQAALASIIHEIRLKQMPDLVELNRWTKETINPTATAFGRMIRFLGKNKPQATLKGILGIDIGANAATVAAAFNDQLILRVYTDLGLASLGKLLIQRGPRQSDDQVLHQVTSWISLPISIGYLREYLANKQLNPANLPVTPEDLAIEQALARYAIQTAVRKTPELFTLQPEQPIANFQPGTSPLPWFEPIIATGSVLAKAPSLPQSMLMILDGLQPTGITTIVLDKNQIFSALGMAAVCNPVLAVQVLDSNAMLPLGTVISPMGNARSGTPILRVKMTYEDGGVESTSHETILDVKQGTLEVLPLPIGQAARIQLQPLHRYDVGMGGAGRGGSLKVMGSALGIIIDGRGRPMTLPRDPQRRYDLFNKWLWTLGR